MDFDDDGDYFSGQPQSPTTPKSPPKTLKTRRRKRDRSVSSSKGPTPGPPTPEKTQTSSTSVPPIFQLLGSITGRASDLYNSWTRPAPAAQSQPPRRGSAATNSSYVTAFNSNNSPLMRDIMMSPELQPLPSLLSVPVNAPPTPPGEDYLKPKAQTQTQAQPHTTQKASPTPATKRLSLPNVTNIRQQALQQATHYSNTFLSSPLLLAGAAVVVGLAITVGRPLLEVYIHKGIHYFFNFIFYATVTAAVVTCAAIAWMLISGKLKKTNVDIDPTQTKTSTGSSHETNPTTTPFTDTTPTADLSRRSSKRRSRRASAATTSASAPPPPMMYPPYGYPPQQQWDEYNHPGHPPMNMYMPPSPMYQPQLFHPVPMRPFEPPQSTPAAPPVTPQTSAFSLPPTPGHARTESGNVAPIPEILQQPKKKPVYRVVQRKIERDPVREARPPLRTRELPPVPREPPQVPKHQGLPAVLTRFEDENSMVNYASPISEVDLKVGDHSFKPYGSPPRRYHGMNV